MVITVDKEGYYTIDCGETISLCNFSSSVGIGHGEDSIFISSEREARLLIEGLQKAIELGWLFK